MRPKPLIATFVAIEIHLQRMKSGLNKPTRFYSNCPGISAENNWRTGGFRRICPGPNHFASPYPSVLEAEIPQPGAGAEDDEAVADLQPGAGFRNDAGLHPLLGGPADEQNGGTEALTEPQFCDGRADHRCNRNSDNRAYGRTN